MSDLVLYWVHNARWETEAELIARLKKLPRGKTLYQLALEAGISKADRSPRTFGALLKKHHITWIMEPKPDGRSNVPYDFWKLDDVYLAREAEAERKAAVAAAKAQIQAGKARIYRGCWAE